ncbi:Nop14-like protein [Testicularia cyperi]|uniref:Nop14-like protein n=1 Tax=Testicularia cyperi TaxID=1882483 RepID=A0A317XZT3_9BASI|nr:Nop14-like protein [Testicularia cyperi]
MAKGGGGSQLKQLKSKLHSSGVSDRRQLSKNSRKRKGGQDEKDAAAARRNKINAIVSTLNPFDEKVTKPKHDVLGRKIKGAVGRPGAAKASGLAQRRATLLPEWEARNRTGSFVDRRFGEGDSSMTPEEKMLERYATEKQRRAAKGAAFNLNDDDDILTHYGQSLSGLDDLADIRLPEDDDEQGKSNTGRLTGQGHFGGFEDDENAADDGDESGKSKADVMRELIAKSKYHKLERQKIKDADDDLREQLDDELADIRGLLYEQPAVPPPNAAAEQDSGKSTKDATSAIGVSAEDKKPASSYDTFVRELAFERRAKPQDRLKSEAEMAAEEAQRLMRAEQARLKRMRGDSDDEGDDDDNEREGGSRRKRKKASGGSSSKRAAQADDLDDDFELDGMTAGEVYGLGAGLAESGAVDEDDEEEDEGDDEEDDFADLADAAEAEQIGEDEEEEQSGEHEKLTGSVPVAGTVSSSKKSASGSAAGTSASTSASKLPFTFTCPATHDELLSTLRRHKIEPKHIPTVVKRIRTLHHASLAEDNKYKLQAFIGVLIDHALHWAGQAQAEQTSTGQPQKLAWGIVNALIPHIFSLSQAYPLASAQHFVSKLALMQRNLSRGLAKGATDPEARTWPGLAELTLLRIAASVWPTSDRSHAVTTPMSLLMAQYLGHARIRSLQDVAAGLFLTSMVIANERDSKRLFPEALNFLFSATAVLAPFGKAEFEQVRATAEEFGIPTPDVDAAHTRQMRISSVDQAPVDTLTEAVDFPALLCAGKGSDDDDAHKATLLSLSLRLTSEFSKLYAGSTSFVEQFTPFEVLVRGVAGTGVDGASPVATSLSKQIRLASSSRRYLRLQAHRAIPIATHVPKFDQQGFNPDRKGVLDPDHERVQLQKMKALIKKERKGAIRELRKDNQFLATVRNEQRQQDDASYKRKIDKIMATLQDERSEQKQLERMKANIKRRAGKK